MRIRTPSASTYIALTAQCEERAARTTGKARIVSSEGRDVASPSSRPPYRVPARASCAGRRRGEKGSTTGECGGEIPAPPPAAWSIGKKTVRATIEGNARSLGGITAGGSTQCAGYRRATVKGIRRRGSGVSIRCQAARRSGRRATSAIASTAAVARARRFRACRLELSEISFCGALIGAVRQRSR
jgi:hypothetical protein